MKNAGVGTRLDEGSPPRVAKRVNLENSHSSFFWGMLTAFIENWHLKLICPSRTLISQRTSLSLGDLVILTLKSSCKGQVCYWPMARSTLPWTMGTRGTTGCSHTTPQMFDSKFSSTIPHRMGGRSLEIRQWFDFRCERLCVLYVQKWRLRWRK